MAPPLETRYLLGSVLAVLLVCAGFLAVSRFMTRAGSETAERRGLDQALQRLGQELSSLKDAETGQPGSLPTEG